MPPTSHRFERRRPTSLTDPKLPRGAPPPRTDGVSGPPTLPTPPPTGRSARRRQRQGGGSRTATRDLGCRPGNDDMPAAGHPVAPLAAPHVVATCPRPRPGRGGHVQADVRVGGDMSGPGGDMSADMSPPASDDVRGHVTSPGGGHVAAHVTTLANMSLCRSDPATLVGVNDERRWT